VPVEFPWREAMDFKEEVDSPSSYAKSLELCRNGLLVGPSSGLALVGLINFLQKRKSEGSLDQLRNLDGEIPCEELDHLDTRDLTNMRSSLIKAFLSAVTSRSSTFTSILRS
jgi:hypothetical protein